LFSRKALAVRACKVPTTKSAWRAFEAAFREYGLPRAILTDGGTPFGAATTGVSRITLRLLKLDIRHEFSRPGTPTDNAITERFNRTLGEETLPPAKNHRAQQRRFDVFCDFFNTVRPHESLDQRRPDDVWTPSPRRYDRHALQREFEYEGWFETRIVTRCGFSKFRGARLYIGEGLAGERIGFEPCAYNLFRVWVGPLLLGLHERGCEQLTRGDISKPVFARSEEPKQPGPHDA
jgi:putative transposase